MFYTINENFVDNFFKDIYTTKPTNRLNSQFEAEVLEDGKQKVTINTSNLASGVYVIQIATQTKTTRVKAVVIH